jgi:hypothetical protein
MDLREVGMVGGVPPPIRPFYAVSNSQMYHVCLLTAYLFFPAQHSLHVDRGMHEEVQTDCWENMSSWTGTASSPATQLSQTIWGLFCLRQIVTVTPLNLQSSLNSVHFYRTWQRALITLVKRLKTLWRISIHCCWTALWGRWLSLQYCLSIAHFLMKYFCLGIKWDYFFFSVRDKIRIILLYIIAKDGMFCCIISARPFSPISSWFWRKIL